MALRFFLYIGNTIHKICINLDHQEVPGGPEGSCSALRRHAAHASVRREIVFLPQDIQVG